MGNNQTINNLDNIKLENYKLSSDEIIVARYNRGKLPLSLAERTFQVLKKSFGEGKVIMISDDVSLEQMPISTLKILREKLINSIDNLISKNGQHEN